MKIYVYAGEKTRKKAEEYFGSLLELGIARHGEISLDRCRIACNLLAREDVAKEPPRDSEEKELLMNFYQQLNDSGLLDIEADGRTLSEITIGLVKRIKRIAPREPSSAAEIEKVRGEVEAFYSQLEDRNLGTRWADGDNIKRLEELDKLRESLEKVQSLAEYMCNDIGYPLG